MQRNPHPNGKNPPKSSFVFFDGLPYQSYTLVLIALLSIQLKVLSYGATISSLKVRDASGAWREVVLGFDSLEGYLADENRLKMNWANVDLTHYNILQLLLNDKLPSWTGNSMEQLQTRLAPCNGAWRSWLERQVSRA